MTGVQTCALPIYNNNHPNRQQSGSASAQNRRGRGSHVNAGQKRKATENVTNGTTGTDDGDHGHAPKRHKNEKRAPLPPRRSNPDPEPEDSPGAHPNFWLSDGSVIIQVEKTKFRLHRTMLKSKSAYFAATFEDKGSHKRGGRAYLEVEIDERSPNGHHLPVYRVTETTADDFATLLTMIDESTCVLYYMRPRPSSKIAIAYRTFCVRLIDILGNTHMRYHRCLSWLVFSAPRALFPLKSSVNGQYLS